MLRCDLAAPHRAATRAPCLRVRLLALNFAAALMACGPVASTGLSLAVTSPVASAQVALQRMFPPHALRGQVSFTNPPEALLNGQAIRMAPGARIRGEDNLLRLPGEAAGQKFTVNYTRDGYGQLLDIWILSKAELVNPWPRTEAEAQQMQFDFGTQRWVKP